MVLQWQIGPHRRPDDTDILGVTKLLRVLVLAAVPYDIVGVIGDVDVVYWIVYACMVVHVVIVISVIDFSEFKCVSFDQVLNLCLYAVLYFLFYLLFFGTCTWVKPRLVVMIVIYG